MTQWPETLPLPFIDFEGEPRNATITGNVQNARIERRSRFTYSVTSLSVRWVLSIAQFDAFETFFLNEIDLGTALFSIELKYPKTSELSGWVVRFTSGYSTSYEEGIWLVDANIDLLYVSKTTQGFYVGDEDSDTFLPFVTLEGLPFEVLNL